MKLLNLITGRRYSPVKFAYVDKRHVVLLQKSMAEVRHEWKPLLRWVGREF